MHPLVRKKDLLMPVLTLATLVALAFVMVWMIVVESNKREELRADVRVELCEEIDLLKEGFRKDAWANWKNLDRNLRLLNIKRTDRIVRIALRQRNNKLEKYASVTGGCDQYRSINKIVDDTEN